PAPLLLVPLANGMSHTQILVMLTAAEFISALGVMMLDIAAGTIAAALIPGPLLARVSGAYTIVNYGVRPIRSPAGGAAGRAPGGAPPPPPHPPAAGPHRA